MFRFLASLVCLLVLSVQGADSAPPPAGKVPRIGPLGSDTAELGQIKGYETKMIRFRVKNTGDAPGEILILIPGCQCVSGTADKTRLEPQEETDISVSINASFVHGAFKRGLWVETSDPAVPRFALKLRGESLPIFDNLPESLQHLALAEGATLTNTFTLTEAEPNFFIGAPIIDADTNKLLATASVATNNLPKRSFDVTLQVTALASGRHKLFMTLPVEGRTNMAPIKLAYDASVGLELKAIPTRILLTASDKPLVRRLNLMTSDTDPSTNALTWTPPRTGLSVRVERIPQSRNLTVILTVAPEALPSLREEKDAHITFHYPNYKPVSVDLIEWGHQVQATTNAPGAPAVSRSGLRKGSGLWARKSSQE